MTALTLTWPVAGAVLFGAFLHAIWNALIKSSPDKALDTTLLQLLASGIALPLMLVIGPPDARAWPYIATSLVLHIGYYIALTGAYRHGELGLTYPLMRGTAPPLVAIATTTTLGEHLSSLAWLGLLGVCCGVLLMGVTKQALESPRAVAFALTNAVLIAAYTVVDAIGARQCGNALQYVVALFVLDGWPYGLAVLRRRGLKVALPYAGQRWPLALGGAVASFGSYGIALWAMQQAPMATVAALRETSVLFAALLGSWFLKERFTLQRAIGTVTILCGAIALRIT